MMKANESNQPEPIAMLEISNNVLVKKSDNKADTYDVYYDGVPKTWINASKIRVENNYIIFYNG